MKKFRRRIAFASGALVLALAAVWGAGGALSASVNHHIAPPPPALNAQTVQFDGVSGWYAPAAGQQCALLLHGVRSDRTSMIKRALFLQKSGYSSLLIDLQGHGETQGEQITFGYRESDNVKSAIAYLRTQRQCAKVAIIGVSLGGAASLLGQSPASADVYVLEAVYPNIEQAVSNRLSMRLGALGEWLTPLLTAQIPLRLGVSLDELRPEFAIKHITAPVLIITGTEDQHTTLTESQHLFDNAPEPKFLWLVKGAHHQDFHEYAPEEYESRVTRFLEQSLY
ncbi:putative lipase [Hahella chejuensis KCTC 2396]|uniref:Putative lipase n=1 Tax=Hahella chejuensis (strain KCTC 2396) TaxID=349521 RepID=Q2SNP8_HAHCH|nr:alpha/beta fold hydrolase [Hahella chejuensis]ABC27726.1 putative lipase [Hahella chejuensis KCTC 2396]